MRKKLISVLLSLTLVMAMTACGSNEESGIPASSTGNSTEGNGASITTEAPTVTEVPAVTDAPTVTEAPAAEPTVAPTAEPTLEPTPEPTKAPTETGTLTGGPTTDEFFACKFEIPLVESGIKGLYVGTYSFALHTNRKLVISENQIDIYMHDGAHYTYTPDQISKDPSNDKMYVINDGSGASITIEDASSVNSDGSLSPYLFYRYKSDDRVEALQGGLLEVFNGKHLYDISYDHMGEWGCIPVTDVIKEKLLSGLVTEDYRIRYSYGPQTMAADSPYVQTYIINAYDIDGSSSESLTLKVYENEELAKQDYEYSSSGLRELDGNMVLTASVQNPLSTLSYYAAYKSMDLGICVYGEHCTFDSLYDGKAQATYFVNPISLEYGAEINKANELFALYRGEYSTEDYMAYVNLSEIYSGVYEGRLSCRYTFTDYTSIELEALLITDVKVEGNKVTLVSNNCQMGTATLAELVLTDGEVQVSMKSYAGVDDLTIVNSGSKTVTAECSFVAKKSSY